MKTTKIVKLQINPETEAERAAIVTALELAVAAHEGDPEFTATVRELEGALPDLRGAVWAAVDFSPPALALLEMGLDVHADWSDEPDADPDCKITGEVARKLGAELEALRKNGGVA